MPRLRAALVSLLLLVGLAGPVFALDPLPKPEGPVVLTVLGRVALHNTADGKAEFDLAMLQALPRSEFSTSTIWTDGLQNFAGVRIADLLARLGSDAAEIDAAAGNDYEFRFPVSDAVAHDAIIAYERNGAPLPADNKGPLWIVYPYDRDPVLATERFTSQSVWNLETMTLY
jgi:hypothetical protein